MADIPAFFTDYLVNIILAVGGILSLFIAGKYVRKRETLTYKGLTALGFIFGILMIVVAVTNYQDWYTSTAVIVAVAGFALVIRPVRDVHFSPILALLVMAVVYIFLGSVTEVGGIDISFMAEGWPRIIIAFLIGAVVFMLFNFAESIIKLFGKILNCWPVLFVLGLICIAEAVCLFLGYGSVYDLVLPYFQD